jgi:amino acid transporter
MTAPSPARTLGVVDAACVVIGAIIGVGIFFSPGRVARVAGTPTLALAGWALAGGIALCGALAFAELGRRRNAAGAQYEVLRDAYGPAGPLAAFTFVFCNATAIQAGAIGVIAFICAENLALAVGHAAPAPGLITLLAVCLIGAVTLINAAGVRFGAAIQGVTVAAKVLALLGVASLAAFATHDTPATLAPPPAGSPFLGLLGALVPAFFAYGGWQHALWISGEVKDPRRTLPTAILAGTAVVVAVYLAVNWAYLSLLGFDRVSTSGTLAADAVGVILPPWGSRAVAAAVTTSAFGVLNAQLLSGPRLIQAMAADGRFWSVFARVHPGSNAPVAAILLLGALGAALAAFAGKARADQLATGVVFVDGIFFLLTALAVFRLPAVGTPLPGSRIASAIFILGELGLLVGAHIDRPSQDAARLGLLWMAGAILLFLFVFRTGPGRRPAP